MNGRRVASMVVWMAGYCLLIATTTNAGAQAKPKLGLWQISTQTQMAGVQMPQLPPGVQLPAGVSMPQGMGGPIITKICITQDSLNKSGGVYSSPPNSNCQSSTPSYSSGTMTLTMTCSGQFTGTDTITSTTSSDGNSSHTTAHMKGTMTSNGRTIPVDSTMQMTSTYLGPDCGSVKPMAMPASN
jgi:hypothetical protein